MSDSNSASGSSKTLQEFECEVCNVPFDTKSHCPRILTRCGHTICEECAEKLWKRGRKLYIRCPFDRKHTNVKNKIDNLPKNYALERLLNLMKAEGVSVPSIPIGICSEDLSHEAWFTCADCEADFCEDCFDIKHSSNEFLDHKKTPSIDKSYEAQKCKKHPENFADSVCQDSECRIKCKAICNVCLLNEHKNHEYGPIVDVVAENQKKLKEELIKKPISEETQLYLDAEIPKKRYVLEDEMNAKNAAVVYNIKCHYNNEKSKAIRKWRKFVEKKLVVANEAMVECGYVAQKEEALEDIRDEIRRRLYLKRKLENVEDLVEKHKKTHEELNRKRDTPIISWPIQMNLKFPPHIEMEITDPNEPSTSTPSTSASPPTQKLFPIFRRKS